MKFLSQIKTGKSLVFFVLLGGWKVFQMSPFSTVVKNSLFTQQAEFSNFNYALIQLYQGMTVNSHLVFAMLFILMFHRNIERVIGNIALNMNNNKNNNNEKEV